MDHTLCSVDLAYLFGYCIFFSSFCLSQFLEYPLSCPSLGLKFWIGFSSPQFQALLNLIPICAQETLRLEELQLTVV